MGKPTGFLEYDRELPQYKSPAERIKDYAEFYLEFSSKKTETQAARCMECGVPFCHNGCPLGNIIPDFNDAVYHQNWKQAYEILSSTNNFPEFTGRICPAPCEASCVLGINKPPVAIEHIEKTIIEKAYQNGWVVACPPQVRTGKKVAVVGSGPAGLATAAQLNKAGHTVTVYERDDKIGGLLRYGIPDFKLDKSVIDRKIQILEEEGIKFQVNVNVGVDVTVDYLLQEYDAVALCGGSTIPRDLPAPGRENKGIYFAMEFLKDNSKRVQGSKILRDEPINVKGANVLVIGGGDTGSDCVGTSNRHGAKSITQIELLPKPKTERGTDDAWPLWPQILRTSSSHEEGCQRLWSVSTKEFIGDGKGNLKAVKIVDLEWETPKPGQRPNFKEVPGSEREIPCEFVFLAMGFVNPQHEGLLDTLSVAYDERGNVKANYGDYATSIPKVFSAGDMRRGQSLVVWAIHEGRECAVAIDTFLMGYSNLESKEKSRYSLK
ncbi:MAG TPA: glutamate synthase subunit beta [Bacteroidales bacterium]|nr:glutamate synthase subunit beta [Bacteroidales bacterium]